MKDNSHAHADAHGAHTHEADDRLEPDFVFDFFVAWKELDDHIKALQDSKKTMMANVRTKYSRHQAEALKITMRRALMDAKERHEATIFNEMASYYVDLLEGEIEARMMGPEPVG